MRTTLLALALLSSTPLFAADAAKVARIDSGNGGDVWYLMYKDEGHGFAKKANNDYFGAASMMFWQKYLLEK